MMREITSEPKTLCLLYVPARSTTLPVSTSTRAGGNGRRADVDRRAVGAFRGSARLDVDDVPAVAVVRQRDRDRKVALAQHFGHFPQNAQREIKFFKLKVAALEQRQPHAVEIVHAVRKRGLIELHHNPLDDRVLRLDDVAPAPARNGFPRVPFAFSAAKIQGSQS